MKFKHYKIDILIDEVYFKSVYFNSSKFIKKKDYNHNVRFMIYTVLKK